MTLMDLPRWLAGPDGPAVNNDDTSAPAAIAKPWLLVGVVLVLFGLALRCWGVFDLELWLDEAMWGQRVARGVQGWIRPIGYMWLTGKVLHVVNTEFTLRLLSWLGSLALLPLLALLLRRIALATTSYGKSTGAREAAWVFALWLLVINPISVAMAKEFKPYALEMMCHALLMLLVLRFVSTQSPRVLVAFMVCSAASPLFAWSVVFAFPSLYIVLLASTWWHRARKGTRPFIAVLGSAGATMVVLLLLFAGRIANKTKDTGFWGRKYDVFYVGRRGFTGKISWLWDHTIDVAAFPAALADNHLPTAIVSGALVALVAVGAIVLLVRRRFQIAILLLMPWLVTIVFNVLGQWPYGLFRTNLFLLLYTLGVLVAGTTVVLRGVAALAGRLSKAAPYAQSMLTQGAPVVLVVVAGALLWPEAPTVFRHKAEGTLTAESSVRAAMEAILAAEQTHPHHDVVDGERWRTRLLLDGHACSTLGYYSEDHVATRDRFGPALATDFEVACGPVGARGWRRFLDSHQGEPAWIISAKRDTLGPTRQLMAARCVLEHNAHLPESTLLLRCAPRSDQVASPKALLTPATTVDDDGDGDDDGDDER